MIKLPLRPQLRDASPDDAAQGRMWDAVRRRTAPRRPRRLVWAAALATSTALLLLFLGMRPRPLTLADGKPLIVPTSGRLALAGGAQLAVEGRVELRDNDGTHTRFRLHEGRLELTPHGPRRYLVESGAFAFSTTTGHFVVASAHHRVDVQVLEGEVELQLPNGRLRLHAGETWESAPPPSVEPAQPTLPAQPAAPNKESWRELAARNQYARAYHLLEAEPPPSRRASLDELTSRADVARLSGHATEAVPLLERAVTDFPEDRRAALAAFTLGRIHADDLHQARPAALAFERAVQLGLPRSLAEDAYARAVESWLQAGDDAAARAAAARHHAQFPSGQYRERIDRWLEAR